FLDAIDQRCGFCQAQHLDSNAAQKQAGKPAAAMAADENKVAAVLFGSLNNAIGHVEIRDYLAACLDAGCFRAIKHLTDVLLGLLIGSLLVVFVSDGVGGGHAIEANGCREWLSDIQGHDFRANGAREADTFVSRLSGKRGTVGRNEDFFEHYLAPIKLVGSQPSADRLNLYFRPRAYRVAQPKCNKHLRCL